MFVSALLPHAGQNAFLGNGRCNLRQAKDCEEVKLKGGVEITPFGFGWFGQDETTPQPSCLSSWAEGHYGC